MMKGIHKTEISALINLHDHEEAIQEAGNLGSFGLAGLAVP